MKASMAAFGSAPAAMALCRRYWDQGEAGLNFLASERRADNIVTNPPYNSAQQFVKKGVELANNRLALLLRLAFLEGGHRAKTIFTD